MKQSVLNCLKSSIKGEIFSQEEIRQFYSVDASSYKIIPKVIIIPKNEEDVINTIKIGKRFKISVTARGAGTGLVGGALNSGIILDMKNFSYCKISKNYVTVGSGLSKGILDKKLNRERKFFAPNPSVGSFCSIGGMIGNNSSGSRSLKYGSMIDNVLEISFIDGNGKKIILPKNKIVSKKILNITKKINKSKFPRVTKNSSGYRIDKVKFLKDSQKIIIGSEGTLGIILSAKLKIRDKPTRKRLYIIGYKTNEDASKECIKINKINPAAIEFVDKATLDKIKFNFEKTIRCLLFVEIDEKTYSNEKKMLSIIKKGQIIQKIKKEFEILQWWRYRDSSLYFSLKSINKEKRFPQVVEDAAVPLENLNSLFQIIEKLNKKHKTKSVIYGHAGNGNLHVRLISNQKKLEKIKLIATEYFDEIIKQKGTITAEHGDGLARSEFIKKQYGVKNYAIFKDLKQFFDPHNILNPDKIITKKSTIVKNLENAKFYSE